MDGAFGSRPRRRRPHINITPLIDVMFLLLIFFMMSSTFRQHWGIDIALPEASTAVEQQRQEHVVAVRNDGGIYFDGEQVTLEQLRASLSELMTAQPEAVVNLEAEKDAVFQDWLDVVNLARELGTRQLLIRTESAPEPAPLEPPLPDEGVTE